MTDMTPHQILSAARLLVCERAPYFRAGVHQLVPRESPDLGTFASTRDWIMLWDPKKAVEWGVEGVAAVVVHELWHLVRDHFGRFSEPLVNQDVANISTDLSINPGVEQMGFKLPASMSERGELKSSGVFPSTFGLPDNLTAEQYYEKLMKMDVRYAFLDAGGNVCGPTVLVEGCGSCSGRPRADEPADDAEGRSEGEARRTRIIIAKAIKDHRGRGTVPGELSRWAEEQLRPPKVNWREKLARVCRAAVAYKPGAGHSTYTRPSRRQGGLGFGPGCPVLPSYRATRPSVTFLVDTSGSMNPDSLARAMSEAKGIFVECGASLDVVVCDAAVHASRRVKSIQEACAMLKGGGGSDFHPAFSDISKRRPKCDIVVAATDGDITVPEKCPPGLQVIWLLVQRGYGGGFRRPCAWGTAIEVE